MKPLPLDDLDDVYDQLAPDWEAFRNKRVFITGGTGFFGRWIVESLLHANARASLNLSLTLLTRTPDVVITHDPQIGLAPQVTLLKGDVRSFTFPEGRFDYVIHGATTASAQLNAEQPLDMLETIVDGTRRVLEMCSRCGCEKLLYISSGAVYGKQPPEMSHMPEDYAGAPDPLDPGSAYGEGKRLGELLCALYARKYGIEAKIARCFAFVGPGLPLDSHFAIGNFLRNFLRGERIHINGSGEDLRSYLYTSDLVVWLFKVFLHGVALQAYNIGSESSVTIKELAGYISARATVDDPKVVITGGLKRISRYVPDTTRARTELGIQQNVDLERALDRTIGWLKDN